jgi:hypothetical protein
VVQIVLQLTGDAGAALRSRTDPSPDAEKILAAAEARGASVQPMHEVPAHDPAAAYFVVDVPDEANAEELRASLASLEAVEAAYTKPPDALP